MNMSDDSSDDDNIAFLLGSEIIPGFLRSTVSGRSQSRTPQRGNKKRDFDAAMELLLTDYFGSSPRYSDADFEPRFRMSRPLFERIFQAVSGEGIFVRRNDAMRKPGIHPLQRVVAAMRMLC